jgi:hypothetical protein
VAKLPITVDMALLLQPHPILMSDAGVCTGYRGRGVKNMYFKYFSEFQII